jgi:hypothetical protein
MRKALAVAMLLVVLGTMAWAQANPPKPPEPRMTAVYKLDFVIAEVEDGKRVNSRTYTLMAKDNAWATTNASTRVPVTTGTGGTGGQQIQYTDVGLSLRFRFREEGDYVIVEGNTNIESFAIPEQATSGMPVTRRISSDVAAAVVPGKPTIISSVDDTNTKKRYQVEVTATKIK